MQAIASRKGFKAIIKILLLVLLIVAGNFLSGWIADQLNLELYPSNEHIVHRVIMLSVIAYTLLMAFPFVPGVEIGLALIVILGVKIVPLVYLCTVLALSLSFIVGRWVPERALILLLQDLHLRRASRLIAQFEGLDTQQRLNFLLSKAPTRIIPLLARYRYLAIIVALNVPGNVLIGGGGGIAMMAGMSRLFSFAEFLLTLAVAVSPVPIAFLVMAE